MDTNNNHLTPAKERQFDPAYYSQGHWHFHPMPDVEFEFKTRLTSDEILVILIRQVDSHVMIDTLKPFDEYTGEC